MAGTPCPGPEREVMLPSTYSMVAGDDACVAGSICCGTPWNTTGAETGKPPTCVVTVVVPLPFFPPVGLITTVVVVAGFPCFIVYTCCEVPLGAESVTEALPST